MREFLKETFYRATLC